MSLPDAPNVLPLEGEIDLHVSPRISAALGAMIEQKPQRLVVDLSKVTYIDSSGLAVLIEGMQNVEAYGGEIFLAGKQEERKTNFEKTRAHPNIFNFSSPATPPAADMYHTGADLC